MLQKIEADKVERHRRIHQSSAYPTRENSAERFRCYQKPEHYPKEYEPNIINLFEKKSIHGSLQIVLQNFHL